MGQSSGGKRQRRSSAKGTVTGHRTESRSAAGPRDSRRQVYLHLLLIAVVGAIVYSNTFHVPFVLDDRKHIMDNQMLKNLENFWLALKGHHFGSGGYRYLPSRFLGYFSFALNYRFGGFSVWGYHLTNIAIHVMNAFLVYFFVRLSFQTPRMYKGTSPSSVPDRVATGSALIALFTSLLFVAHPIQTQAVTYVVQRFASLATMFYLLSIVLYIKGRLGAMGKGQGSGEKEQDNAVRPLASRLSPFGYYFFSLLFAVCAMKTKEISFTLPIVIVLYEFIFFVTPLKKKLLFLLPVLLTIVIVPLSVSHSGKSLGEILSEVGEMTRVQTQIPRWDYLMTEMRVIATYIRLLVLPINQNLDYDYPIYHSLFAPPVFLSFLFLSGLFGTAVYLLYKSAGKEGGEDSKEQGLPAKRNKDGDGPPLASDLSLRALRRLIAFGIFWFFITLSVESSVIPIADVIFEHRLYLPSVGFFTAVATGVFLGWAKLRRGKSIIPVMVVVTLALSGAAFARNNTWRDNTRIWEDIVKKSPDKARPHNNLGVVYRQDGRLDEAMKEYRIAVRLNPDYADAHNNLGVVYQKRGLLNDALEEYQIALRLNPKIAMAHNNRGIIYGQQGRLDEAMGEFQAAVKINPDFVDAHNNLGVVYQQKGRVEEAKKEFQTALRLNPDYAVARKNLASLGQPSSP